MTYLVDANVLSEPTQSSPNSKVLDWLRLHEDNIVVDSIILGELCLGLRILPAGRKRTRLEAWFDCIVKSIECLAWDARIGRRWARLVAELRRRGCPIPVLDSMIAATALEHDLTVVTRNISDFRKTSVRVFNPFA